MKLLTLNTHSLLETEYEEKLKEFVRAAEREQPDIMCLQEVNQRRSALVRPSVMLPYYVRCSGYTGVIRLDNHAARIAELLTRSGHAYYWTWIPIKIGYGIYDEGMAIFSKYPIKETEQFFVSKSEDYKNWKSRKCLGISIEKENAKSWFYSVHMGWWNDDEEPFKDQWNCLENHLTGKTGNIWLLGDFNSPAHLRCEGYDYVKQHGWKDTYFLAREKDAGCTVKEKIDGWRDGFMEEHGMRIDYIWCKEEVSVKSSRVICDGKQYAKVSDHNGLIIEVEEKDNE